MSALKWSWISICSYILAFTSSFMHSDSVTRFYPLANNIYNTHLLPVGRKYTLWFSLWLCCHISRSYMLDNICNCNLCSLCEWGQVPKWFIPSNLGKASISSAVNWLLVLETRFALFRAWCSTDVCKTLFFQFHLFWFVFAVLKSVIFIMRAQFTKRS